MKSVREWTRQDEIEHSTYAKQNMKMWEAGYANATDPTSMRPSFRAENRFADEETAVSVAYSAYSDGMCAGKRAVLFGKV